MLTIFNGRERGTQTDKPTVFIKVDVALRHELHRFWNGKNANALTVFIALALHMDAGGWCWPSQETLMKETGIRERDTITAALHHLVDAELDSQPVLAVYRRVNNSNVYHLFPSLPGEVPAKLGQLLPWDADYESSSGGPVEPDDGDPVEPDHRGPVEVGPVEPGTNKNQVLNKNQKNHTSDAAAPEPMAPIHVYVPDGSKARRSAYTERCTECGDGEGLTQTLDWCKTCGRPVVWHNSPEADQRAKDAKRGAADAKAKARVEQENHLSPLCGEIIALARASSIKERHGGSINFNPKEREQERLADYERAYGAAAIRELLQAKIAEGKTGRGLIATLLNACEYYHPPSPQKKSGQPFNIYDQDFSNKEKPHAHRHQAS